MSYPHNTEVAMRRVGGRVIHTTLQCLALAVVFGVLLWAHFIGD